MVEPLPVLERLLGDAGYAMALTQAIYFVVSFLTVYFVGRATVVPLVGRFLDRRDLDRHAKTPLLKLTKFGVVFVAVSVAFGFADYGNFLTSLATIAAAATLAIGLATQDVIKNFVSGVFIYTDKPFKIGDWVEWDGGSYSGIVEDIGLRVTRVRTFDNELLTVPNSQLTDGVIKNPVEGDRLRLKFLFGIGYDDDIDRATEIIVEEAEDHPDVLDDPAPSVRLTELGDSSVGLQSRVWIADPSRSDYVKTRGEYVTAVKERFDAEGIDIPYPNRTLGGGLELTNVEGTVEAADD
ncbi:mechanosensitive ion channel family protein [Halorussus caseinilyticus]|uniref:mechanosensitive ion channel family protein n=1 Tax=Halorussus caseinilyticus TaxID=3034025 RepID=UPI0023E79DBC|nr:mechanosensitive ion channel family protein [Halorussus sp. DT72]